MERTTSRRAVLGLAAAGAAAGVAKIFGHGPAGHPAAALNATRTRRPPVPENSLPGDPHWVIRHLGGEHAIEGYAGKASVLAGESFPLFVSAESRSFRVTGFRLGGYQGTGARKVWKAVARKLRDSAETKSG